jgi:hypothetical protein
MFFELKNGKVVVTEQALLNASVRNLYEADHTKGKIKFHKMATYIFQVYDKRSIYMKMSFSDRQKLVSKECVEEEDYWKKAESNRLVQELIEMMNKLQFTHKERLLEGAKRKIDEYVAYFDLLKLNKENEKLYRETAKGSEDLIDFYDKLEQKVNKEALSRQVGGGDSKIFEDEG